MAKVIQCNLSSSSHNIDQQETIFSDANREGWSPFFQNIQHRKSGTGGRCSWGYIYSCFSKVWIQQGIPENPSAWFIYRCRNKPLICFAEKFSDTTDFTASESVSAHSPFVFMDNFWKEELVRTICCVWCSPAAIRIFPEENQITLILKLLCGFNAAEIAKAFLTSEKPLPKAQCEPKHFSGKIKLDWSFHPGDDLNKRTGAVLHSVYLLFNGDIIPHHEELVRKDLIGEGDVIM